MIFCVLRQVASGIEVQPTTTTWEQKESEITSEVMYYYPSVIMCV